MDLVIALYWIAGISTGLFLLRLALMFVGFDHDVSDGAGADELLQAHDIAEAAEFKAFTITSLIVLLMVGAWTALLFMDGFKSDSILGLSMGVGAGAIAGLGVSYALFSMRKLQHDGTLRDFEAKGLKGQCYVRVPENGRGKVQVNVNGRKREFDAISDGPAIESFKPIVVMERVDENTLRVCEVQ